ncbi:nucleolar protein dao-5-like isoform X1 [Haliotis rufescens]|uniref:nucleolar protein dao-5-like isoform X1 n=1 Tax=Haliotis rufescens TaxID=6454 RepID=UPI00201F421E|nr:nucleolar protein dao-5-like isoform X1 [Haliotis rufescens]
MAGESSGGDSSQQNAIDRLSVVFDRIYGSEYRAARRLIHKRLRQKDMGSPGKKPPAQRDNSLYLRIMAFRHKESPGTSPQPSGDATPPRSQQSNRPSNSRRPSNSNSTPQRQSPQANKTPQRTPPQSNRNKTPYDRGGSKSSFESVDLPPFDDDDQENKNPTPKPTKLDHAHSSRPGSSQNRIYRKQAEATKAEDPTTARDVYVEMGDEERDSPKRMSRNQSRQDDLPPVREATPRRADRPLSRAASDLNKHSVVPPINKEDDSRNSRNSRHSTPDQRQSSRPPSNQNRTPSRNNTPSSDDARATILSPRNQPKPNTPPRMEAAVPSSSNADDQPIERAGPSNVHSSRPDDNPTDDYDDDDDSPEPDIPARTPKVREEDGRIAALEKLADYNLKTLAGQDAGEAPEIDDKIMNEVFSPEFQKDLDNFLKS